MIVRNGINYLLFFENIKQLLWKYTTLSHNKHQTGIQTNIVFNQPHFDEIHICGHFYGTLLDNYYHDYRELVFIPHKILFNSIVWKQPKNPMGLPPETSHGWGFNPTTTQSADYPCEIGSWFYIHFERSTLEQGTSCGKSLNQLIPE